MKALAGVVALSALLLAGCESGEIKKVKASVADKMRDPGSTEFRNIQTTTNTEGLTSICGEVNSKNAFGAYVGYKRFIGSPVAPEIVYLEATMPNTFERFWNRYCM